MVKNTQKRESVVRSAGLPTTSEFLTLFTPQPLGLEGYGHHGLGGRLPNLWYPYLCNLLTEFLHSKFFEIV